MELSNAPLPADPPEPLLVGGAAAGGGGAAMGGAKDIKNKQELEPGGKTH